tara:strand:+ start:646 stop:1047 length:402 start_codon:yes stop_codon:yes gene_type:complete
MWADSGAGALTFANIFISIITFVLVLLIVILFGYQYLRKRSNKLYSNKVAILGMFISIVIFLINLFIAIDNINFVQDQIEIANDTSRNWFPHIREGWIKSGNRIITWKIAYSIIFGVLPFWKFFNQNRKNVRK